MGSRESSTREGCSLVEEAKVNVVHQQRETTRAAVIELRDHLTLEAVATTDDLAIYIC
jgi:hypothetical protein